MLNDLTRRGGKATARCVETGHGRGGRATRLRSPTPRGTLGLTSDLSIYAGLFVSALLAATILPVSSEAMLAGLLAARAGEVPLLLAVATLGNTLGSVVNWLIGRALAQLKDRPWFPVSAARYAAAEQTFRRYGMWSLLFAWLPLVGDPLTLAAGALRAPFLPFVLLVAAGKAARYAAIVAGFSLWAG